MERKNMAYWRAKNMLPGINQNSEGNTDLPDGKSGSSPLQEDKFTTEQLIAQANKKFGGGITVQPKESTTDVYGKILPGVEADAKTAFNTMSRASSAYKGSQTFSGLSYKDKQKFRTDALAYQKKKKKRKSKTETSD